MTVTGVLASPIVGQTVQLAAQAVRQNGTSIDATTQATWQSTDSGIGSVSATGALTIAGPGDAEISATVQGVRGTARMTVSKPVAGPTLYDLDGVVHESAPTQDVAVQGATVGIHYVGYPACPHDNEEAVTDANGRFRLPGIAAPGFALMVTKPGYELTIYGIADLPRDRQPAIALSPTTGNTNDIVTGECHGNTIGSVTARFPVIRDGFLHQGPFAGPTVFAPGFSTVFVSYRRIGHRKSRSESLARMSTPAPLGIHCAGDSSTSFVSPGSLRAAVPAGSQCFRASKMTRGDCEVGRGSSDNSAHR